jgi:hypothetical protein
MDIAYRDKKEVVSVFVRFRAPLHFLHYFWNFRPGISK